MDKELLRLVILGMGGVLIVVIVLWGILANRKSRKSVSFYDKRDSLGSIDQSLVINTSDDDFDIVPLGSAGAARKQDALDFDLDPDLDLDDDTEIDLDESDLHLQKKVETLSLVQFSVVAKNDEGFKGSELFEAFKSIGLTYSDMQIFQRLDEAGLPDYAVASLVEPGTFPEHDFEDFHCPGIVFFMQPGELDNPLDIYDEMVSGINHMAFVLDGIEWDSERQPLTVETVQTVREQLCV